MGSGLTEALTGWGCCGEGPCVVCHEAIVKEDENPRAGRPLSWTSQARRSRWGDRSSLCKLGG